MNIANDILWLSLLKSARWIHHKQYMCLFCGCWAEGLVDVIVYNSPDDPSKFNRGFAFLDYDSHKTASAARRTIVSTRLQVWGSEVIVEWAEPQEEPDAETMAKVWLVVISYNC